ncbi:MAG: prolyl oligopeptidase family serine peptidase, partial [Planctomycetales bacterium]|nr:prolyl oligopeptidase family serine peptidase [Planctomycetales bacterium]
VMRSQSTTLAQCVAMRLVLIVICTLIFGACSLARSSAALFVPHPDDTTKQVEYFVEQPDGTGPWPTIVLLHGHQDSPRRGGQEFVDWGVLKQLARRGYLAVAISQPAYGNSTGPADFCGEFTQHAVTAVTSKLRADGLALQDRLLLLGISRGALTAGLIAGHDPTVTGLVLISGVYDLPAYVADKTPSVGKQFVVKTIQEETGGSAAALHARSVVTFADRIKAKTLILNGAQDDRTDPRQARRLAEAITRAGGDAEVIVYQDFGHRIPVQRRNQDVDPFIDAVLRSGGRE